MNRNTPWAKSLAKFGVTAIGCIGNKRFDAVQILSGIKLGDPTSGTLRALLYDLSILRMCLVIPRSLTSAYADDVALVFSCFTFGILALLPLLRSAKAAAGMGFTMARPF